MKLRKWIKGKYLGWLSSRSKHELISQALISNVNPDHFPDSLKDPDAY